jgi:hypothetical protein
MSNIVPLSSDAEIASASSWPLRRQRLPITEYIAPSIPQPGSVSPLVDVDGSNSPNQDDAFSMIDVETGNTPGEELGGPHDNERTRFIKELFEGPATCQCCVNWVADCPEKLEEITPPDSGGDEDEEAFTVRRRRTYGGSKTWEIHSIEVNSKPLRAVLLKVFEDFDGLILGLKYLRFLAPFKPFYWRWDRFEKAIAEQHDENLIKPLKALSRLVKGSFAKAVQTSKELLSHGVIGHSYLWALFKPGDLIYSNEDGHDRFYVLQSIVEYPQIEFDLVCRYVDFDGLQFGYAVKKIQIFGFSETVSITKLKAFPAKYLDSLDQVQEKVLARGRSFRDLAGVHCKSYRESAHAKVCNLLDPVYESVPVCVQ